MNTCSGPAHHWLVDSEPTGDVYLATCSFCKSTTTFPYDKQPLSWLMKDALLPTKNPGYSQQLVGVKM